MSGRAIFLDRDGTLVEARHFPASPEELVVYDGLPGELRKLQELGFRLVLVTNQSGIARGYFTETDLERMHRALRHDLGRHGVRVDGIYFCPHHEEGVIPELAISCDCRKPAPGMLLQAAVDLDIDLRRSWFVGDILDDVEAGNRAGCRTVLVDLGTESPPDRPIRRPEFVAASAVDAAQCIHALESGNSAKVKEYLPAGWQAGDLGLLVTGVRGRPDGRN